MPTLLINRPAPIYLDHHATTPVRPEVAEAIARQWLPSAVGNPQSRTHRHGMAAGTALAAARGHVAALLGLADAEGVVFTSGATESIRMALRGVAVAARSSGEVAPGRRRILVPRTEHRATLDAAAELDAEGLAGVQLLDVESDGSLDLDKLTQQLGDDALMVSLSWANNEIGTIHPIAEIGKLCAERGVVLHVDASQAPLWCDVDVSALPGVGLVSISGHKMGAPQGIGALWIRRRGTGRVRFPGTQHGGLPESSFRPGTPPVGLAVGLGVAAHLAMRHRAELVARVRELRAALWQMVYSNLGANAVCLHGFCDLDDTRPRLPNNLNLGFDGVDGAELFAALQPHVSVSAGSACTSGQGEPSHVLRALGVSPERAFASVRIGLGWCTTEADVAQAGAAMVKVVRELRGEETD